MPVNDAQYRIAKELNKRQQSRIWSLADHPDMNFEDPVYKKTRQNFDFTTKLLDEYEGASRKVDDAGKLTAPPVTRLPSEVISENAKGFNYHYEPSIAEAQSAYSKDRQLPARLGVDQSWIYGVGQPEKAEDVTDQTTGQVMGQNVVPAKSHLELMTEEDEPYKLYANRLWEDKMAEAKAKGQSLQRYRDVHFRKGQKADYLAGGAEYLVDRRLAPFALGAADTMSMGQATPLYSAMRDLAEYKIDQHGDDSSWLPPSGEDVINRSPGSHLAGGIAASFIPGDAAVGIPFTGFRLPLNPANALQEAGASALGYGGGGLYKAALGHDAGIVGKAAISGALGAGINAAEGASRDFAQGLGEGQGPLDAAGGAAENVGENSLAGTLGGAGFDLLGQGAGGIRDSMRESKRMKQLLTLERAGGGSTLLRGVHAPPEVKAYVRRSSKGEIGSPGALAAEGIAPQMREHLDQQAVAEAKAVDAQMREYNAHPGYNKIKVSSKPLVQVLVDMVGEGRFHAPVSGAPMHMDQDVVRTIQREVVGHKWAEPEFGEPQAAAQYAQQVDGIVVDLDTAKDIFGELPEDVAAGDVAVIVPHRMTAKELTAFEDKVYGKLKPNEQGSRAESPVYEKLDLAAKEVRDKFPYYVDENGKLVDPPGTPSGSPQGPTSGKPSAQPPPMPGNPPSSGSADADTLERVSAGEMQVGSQDFVQPSSLEAEDVRAMPPSRMPAAQEVAPKTEDPAHSPQFWEFTPERIQQKLGVSLEEATVIADRLHGGRQPLPAPTGAPSTEELNSGDFIPQTEELKSNDFLPGSGGELGSADFQPETIEPANGPPTARLRDLRRRAIPEGPQKGDYEDNHDYLMARAKWRFKAGKATAGDKARFKKAADAIPPTERVPAAESSIPQTKRSISPDEEATPLSLLAGNKLAMDVPDEPFATSGARDYPDESVPGPMAKDWQEANKETKDWYEDIISPGRDPRSGESKRMADLTNQQSAMEDANAQVRDVEERLGPMDDEGRMKAMLGILSKKLGREVTKEDLVRAGLLAGGVAAASSDDENSQGVGVGAMVLGGFGGKLKPGQIRQLEEKLDDGTIVKGFSALRRKQHLSASELQKIRQRTGVDADKATIEKIIRFNQTDDINSDKALLKVAKELGIEQELYRAAGTGAYQDLKDRVLFQGGEGARQALFDFTRHRGDKAFELLSGAPRNPFDKTPQSALGAYGRSAPNLTGGRGGVRHVDNLLELYHKLFPGEEKSNAAPEKRP